MHTQYSEISATYDGMDVFFQQSTFSMSMRIDSFYTVRYCMKWVKTSWTYSIQNGSLSIA